ncbi:adenosine 5'-monophosphoramidase HINT3-like isoform X2 [Schistocerca americana]|uniref:adenosine 5'-monophosphoramidase HINT3-like isoform X2 n=1 Tax=Schistocerca americana TaxID=7009 RepID=UPI001F4F3DD2|nr:adenosine 5'-monophosphoramidase HINT3-like isoform X2 [Schistocerca americana]
MWTPPPTHAASGSKGSSASYTAGFCQTTLQAGPPATLLILSTLRTVEDMVRIGKEVLEERGGDLSDLRLGFHFPPFYSVGHLHLHVISPASDMSFVSLLMFRNNSWRFVSPEYVKSHL